MITIVKTVPEFLGLMTLIDPSQLPLGAALSCKNLAQLQPGRLRRIPGITSLATVAVDGLVVIPLLVNAAGLSGSDHTLGVYVGASTVTIVNLTDSAALTGGPTLSGSFGDPWSYTFYAQKHLIAGGGNPIQEITSDTARATLTGTNVPVGNLIQSFLDRLYVADITSEEGIVRYSDALTTDFQANSLINTKEIPGKITALAVNSPSTDVAGIYTQLVIFKRNAIWVWDETSKDIVSQKVGTNSPATVKNTNIGMIFLGARENINSVFWLPIGTPGEPRDIGEMLHNILNGSTSYLYDSRIANASFDGRFYKLFVSLDANSKNDSELWLDVHELARTGRPVWYGIHTRGGVDASCETKVRTEFARRKASGQVTWFAEKSSADSGFTDMDGNTMEAVLDLPLNVDPLDDEKVFDSIEIRIAKEANTTGNQFYTEAFAEGVSQGEEAFIFYQETLPGVVRAVIAFDNAAGVMGMAARDVRIKLRHTLDARLDIIGATVQYLIHEGKEKIRAQVLQQTAGGTLTGIRRQ